LGSYSSSLPCKIQISVLGLLTVISSNGLTGLKLGSSYVSFLEKISDMFEKMAETLPMYEEFIATIRARVLKKEQFVPERLLKNLAIIYSDVIQFCQEACSLFTKRKGGCIYLSKM
jgi:hypothetical protein